MNAFLSIIVVLFAVLGLSAAHAADTTPDAPVVVELFTSQSCSSCPPADRLLSELAQKPGVIPLSCHVTYWDNLGWKDTLSHDLCTQRQYDYANRMKNNGVYTPQMVVNGREEFVGSKSGRANDAIATAQSSPIARVALLHGANGAVIAELPASIKAGMIYLISYRDRMEQAIGAGENGGSTITYVNPVQSIEAMPWNGRDHHLVLIPAKTAPHHAVIVQDGVGGPVLAAGKI